MPYVGGFVGGGGNFDLLPPVTQKKIFSNTVILYIILKEMKS